MCTFNAHRLYLSIVSASLVALPVFVNRPPPFCRCLSASFPFFRQFNLLFMLFYFLSFGTTTKNLKRRGLITAAANIVSMPSSLVQRTRFRLLFHSGTLPQHWRETLAAVKHSLLFGFCLTFRWFPPTYINAQRLNVIIYKWIVYIHTCIYIYISLYVARLTPKWFGIAFLGGATRYSLF